MSSMWWCWPVCVFGGWLWMQAGIRSAGGGPWRVLDATATGNAVLGWFLGAGAAGSPLSASERGVRRQQGGC